MDDVVLFEVQDRTAVLSFNRPERLNAWTPELQTRYFDLLEECATRDDVRVIVLTGAGRGFCAGADMQHLAEVMSGEGNGASAPETRVDARPVTFALTIPKPIIAAINGPCAGLGLVHALMCDLRFAAASAKITTAFSRRGLVAEHGIAWMLPRLVGPARALDLLLSGRVVLGEEAAELGLVNRAVADELLMDEVLGYARMLATECSPASMATMKAQIYRDYDRTLADSLAQANELMVQSFSGPDFAEGVSSFTERRAPEFVPLPGTGGESVGEALAGANPGGLDTAPSRGR